jgi:putative inorganic carbon (HCO3(-)) transporter
VRRPLGFNRFSPESDSILTFAEMRASRAGARPRPTSRVSVPVLLTLYVVLLPVQFQVVKGFNFAPSDLFLCAFLVFQPNCLRFRRAAWSIWHLALLPMMVFSAWVGVERIGELTQYVFVNKLLGALWLLIGYSALSAAMTSATAVRSLARSFVASVCVVNIISIAGFLWPPLESFSPRLNYSAGERVAGFLLDPNAFGGLVLTALVLQAVTALSKVPLFRGLLNVLICASLVVGLALTFSRSAWIGLAVAIIFLGALRPLQSLKMAAVIVGTGLILLAYAANNGFSHFYALSIRPGTIQTRIDSGGIAFEGFMAHPILGTGLGTFLYEHGMIIHNTYLWVLSECGILGTVVILGLTMWYFKVAIPVIRSARGPSQGLIIALAAAHAGMIGVSVGIEVLYQRYWWLIMAMIVACQPSPARTRFVKVWFKAPPDPDYKLSPHILVQINSTPFREMPIPLQHE